MPRFYLDTPNELFHHLSDSQCEYIITNSKLIENINSVLNNPDYQIRTKIKKIYTSGDDNQYSNSQYCDSIEQLIEEGHKIQLSNNSDSNSNGNGTSNIYHVLSTSWCNKLLFDEPSIDPVNDIQYVLCLLMLKTYDMIDMFSLLTQ